MAQNSYIVVKKDGTVVRRTSGSGGYSDKVLKGYDVTTKEGKSVTRYGSRRSEAIDVTGGQQQEEVQQPVEQQPVPVDNTPGLNPDLNPSNPLVSSISSQVMNQERKANMLQSQLTAPRPVSNQETISRNTEIRSAEAERLLPTRRYGGTVLAGGSTGKVQQPSQVQSTWDALQRNYNEAQNKLGMDVDTSFILGTVAGAANTLKDLSAIDPSTGKLRVPLTDTAKGVWQIATNPVQTVKDFTSSGARGAGELAGSAAVFYALPKGLSKLDIVKNAEAGLPLGTRTLNIVEQNKIIKSGALPREDVLAYYGERGKRIYDTSVEDFKKNVNAGFETELYLQEAKTKIPAKNQYFGRGEAQTQLRPNTAIQRAAGRTTDVLSPREPLKSAATTQEAIRKTYGYSDPARMENVRVYADHESVPLRKDFYQTNLEEFHPKLEDARSSFDQLGDMYSFTRRTGKDGSVTLSMRPRRSPLQSELVFENPVTYYENPFKHDRPSIESFTPAPLRENFLLKSTLEHPGMSYTPPRYPGLFVSSMGEKKVFSTIPAVRSDYLVYPLQKSKVEAVMEQGQGLRSSTKNNLDVVPASLSKITQALNVKSATSQQLRQGLRMHTKSAQEQELVSLQLVEQAQKSDQKQFVINEQIVKQEKTPRRMYDAYKNNPFQKMREPTKVPLFKIPTVQRRSVQGFDVLTTRFGKKIRISNSPLSEGEALKFGAKYTRNTAAASFFIKPSRGMAVASDNSLPRLADFYKSRRTGALVQKNKFRISSPGEKREIPGVAAYKKRNKMKRFFGG